ncbi:MAG: tetratricopeptide repeat protein [Prevotellaceae bacterium]|jgi:tetratricopeptide (TPR) repeat protein|nr:tetratricopeptide repeat protein [Prevotellaceae bacterium]
MNLRDFVKNIILLLFLTVSNYSFAQYDKYYYFSRGRDHLINSRYAYAITDFSILIQADSSLYDGYFFRGIAKYNLNDYIGALQDFNKALQINPVYTQAYHYRAITYSQMNRFDEAMKDYEYAMALRPDNVGIHFSRGITYLMSQKFDKSIEDFNIFLRHEPNSSDAFVNRGTAYLMSKDTIKALGDYNKAIYFNAFDPNGYIRRARIYAARNENQKAIRDLDHAIKLDSTSSFVYFSRALVRYTQDDLTGALNDLSRVIVLDPYNALSYYNRALIRSQIGDYNNALEDYGHVMDINPDNVLVYFNRAAVEIELNDYHAAIIDYTKAIELYPDFATAYMNRSIAKNQIGDYEDARKDYDIAQQKIAQFRKDASDSVFSLFADTSKMFNKLLALDADFAKKTFNNRLENRNIAQMIQPMFKFTENAPKSALALDKQYFFPLIDDFLSSETLKNVTLSNLNIEIADTVVNEMEAASERLIRSNDKKMQALGYFIKGLSQAQSQQFSNAISYYTKAISLDPTNIFFYLNRSVVQSDMIDYISKIENSIPKLSLENNVVSSKSAINRHVYDYTEASNDLDKLESLNPNFAYLHYNRGNVLCLSDKMPEAIEAYTKAIKLYPYFAEAYFNRGIVSIYLRDTEKGCIDISKSGEMGVKDAYLVIKRYCIEEN